MGLLYVDTISPQSGTNLTIGESGQNTVLPGNDIRTNVLQDAGGNAILTSDGAGNLSSVASGFGSAMVLLNTTTFANTATAGVTFGNTIITSTYSLYIIRWYNVNMQTAATALVGQWSSDNGTSWNTYNTSGLWQAQVTTSNTSQSFNFDNSYAHSNSNGWIYESREIGNDTSGPHSNATEGASGEMYLYNPASTTQDKMWFINESMFHDANYNMREWFGGYLAQTAAINAIHFKAAGGNMYNGYFRIWGIK